MEFFTLHSDHGLCIRSIAFVQVPLVCVNDNYPPEFFDEAGNLNFPDFLPPRSDFILQVTAGSECLELASKYH